jgi:hypothetical protein
MVVTGVAEGCDGVSHQVNQNVMILVLVHVAVSVMVVVVAVVVSLSSIGCVCYLVGVAHDGRLASLTLACACHPRLKTARRRGIGRFIC